MAAEPAGLSRLEALPRGPMSWVLAHLDIPATVTLGRCSRACRAAVGDHIRHHGLEARWAQRTRPCGECRDPVPAPEWPRSGCSVCEALLCSECQETRAMQCPGCDEFMCWACTPGQATVCPRCESMNCLNCGAECSHCDEVFCQECLLDEDCPRCGANDTVCLECAYQCAG